MAAGNENLFNNTTAHQEEENGERGFYSSLALGLSILLLYAASVAANAGIVLYERLVSGTYRTLVNKLAAAASVYNLVTATAVLPAAAAREASSSASAAACGLPVQACWALQLLVRVGIVQVSGLP